MGTFTREFPAPSTQGVGADGGMFLLGLANRVPDTSLSQADVWRELRTSACFAALRNGSQEMLRRVLLGNSGIDARQFSFANPDTLAALDAGELNRRFESAGAELATAALAGALQNADVRPGEIDAIVLCTCTGYVCPGLSSHVAERLGLRADVILADLVGMGCGAAIPALRHASSLLASGARRVACAAVEICSAAFYLEDDPGVLVSFCLFGDGASASVWGGTSPGRPSLHLSDFHSLHLPQHRESLRFANDRGRLKNVLAPEVPTTAARAVQMLHSMHAPPGATALVHPGGRKVLDEIAAVLPGEPLTESRAVLREHGNMSSPSILFALEKWISSGQNDISWLAAFGAGFTCNCCTARRINPNASRQIAPPRRVNPPPGGRSKVQK